MDDYDNFLRSTLHRIQDWSELLRFGSTFFTSIFIDRATFTSDRIGTAGFGAEMRLLITERYYRLMLPNKGLSLQIVGGACPGDFE